MGRNTLRRQLERALQEQKEYEQANSEMLKASREAREEAAKRKQEAAEEAAAEEAERQRVLTEARQKMRDQTREWAASAQKENETALAEGKKRKPKQKKKSNQNSDNESSGAETSEAEGKEVRPKRKRRVNRPNAISEEKVVESEEDVEDSTAVSGDENPRNKKRKVLSQARIIDSDDEEDMAVDEAEPNSANGGGVHEGESDDGLFGGEEMGDD
jgi:RNA polymerase-associated protein CTR9